MWWRSTSSSVRSEAPSPGAPSDRPGGARRLGGLLGRFRDRRGKGVDREHLAVGEHREPLDDVSQLPDVPRPGIPRQAHHGLGGDLEALPAAVRIDPEEVLDEERDVLRPLAQWRHVDLDHGDAVVEVLAEPGSLDLLSQILVRGGDHPDVGLDVPVGADPAELAGLERAQDLDLGRRAHLADLVQEQGALVRRLEEPVLESVRARERAALVAEELALEEGVLERAAVDDGQRRGRARAVGMESPGDQLLAGAALPLDQDRGERPRGLVDQSEDALDSRAPADDLGEGVVSPERRLEMQGLAPPDGLLVGRPEDLVQVLEVEGLRDEVEGAVPGDFRRRGHGAAGGGDDDLRRRGHGADRPQRVRSRHAGQVQVEKGHADVSRGRPGRSLPLRTSRSGPRIRTKGASAREGPGRRRPRGLIRTTG